MASQEEEKKTQEGRLIRQVIDVNTFYINGGNISITPSDLQLTGTLNGRPTAIVVMSFPVAKAIIAAMQTAIADYEGKTGINIPEVTQIAEKLKR